MNLHIYRNFKLLQWKVLAGFCLSGTAHSPLFIFMYSFFKFQWLPAWRVGWEGKKEERCKTAGSKHLTGGCQHPLPVVCRLGSGAVGQSAPPPPTNSIYLRVCRIWLRRCSFHDDPFWRKYNVSGKKRRGFLLPYRFIIEHEPPMETLKLTKNKECSECWVISCLFSLILTAAVGNAKQIFQPRVWFLAFHLKVL